MKEERSDHRSTSQGHPGGRAPEENCGAFCEAFETECVLAVAVTDEHEEMGRRCPACIEYFGRRAGALPEHRRVRGGQEVLSGARVVEHGGVVPFDKPLGLTREEQNALSRAYLGDSLNPRREEALCT